MAVFPVTPRPERAFLAAAFLSVFLLTGLHSAPAAIASVGGAVMDAGESRTAGSMTGYIGIDPSLQQADAQSEDSVNPGDDSDTDTDADTGNDDQTGTSVVPSDMDDHATETGSKLASRTAHGHSKGAPSPAAADSDASPGTLHQDFNQIEPIGLLTEGPDGGLGEDVWIGSTREKITDLIPRAPKVTYFPVIQDLLRRLYLTEAKPEYLSGNYDPEPGQDLLTLRIEKLESMGMFSDATKLYSQITDVPYHERLARAGVLSMMEGGKGALGCLETRTVMARFGELEFWQTLNAVCDLSLARLLPEDAKKDEGSPEANDIDLKGSDSKIIARIASDREFAYRVSSQKDITVLSPLERAALQDMHALVFEGFHFDPAAPVSPAAFGMLLGSRNLDGDMKFIVLVKAASHGLRPLSDIQEQYDLTKDDVHKEAVGWVRLSKLYAKAGIADPGPAQAAVISQALQLSHSYGGPYAVTPFASLLASANPEDFSADLVQDAVRIMIIDGETVPAAWMNRLAEQVDNQNTLLLFMTAELNSDLSTESKYKQPSLKTLFEQLPQREKVIAAAVYEKLDKDNELHNYADRGVYEKLIGLTRSVDYGMPMSDLTKNLTQAYKDKKLGESILLSAIALQGMQPTSLSPGLLQEVVGGMRTVGLTKEARALATEAILGLK